MKHILIALLTSCAITLFAQQKKMVNPTIISQDKLRKTEAMKLPAKPVDSIQLKPPAGGGTSPEILYNDEQIKAIINEALGYYQKEFTSEQIIILVKNKYNLSLAQATRVMYNARHNNYQKERLDTPWPYDLQPIVSKAYGSVNLATPVLLKQGGETRTFPFLFFYHHFLSLMPGLHPEVAEKMSDHFKLYIEAGYTTEEIYTRSFTENEVSHDIRPLWVPYFVMGMKKAKVPVQNLISVFRTYGTFGASGYGTWNEVLLNGGYTQTEINNAPK